MTVFANGLEVSSKAQGCKVIAAFPDTCFTPPQTPATPPGVPIPYPDFGTDSDVTSGSGTVKIGGKEISQENSSKYSKCTGDEAGAAPKKGIITSKNTGAVYAQKWSMDVKVEGKGVVRFSDMATSNHSSNPGDSPPMIIAAKINIGNSNCAAILQKCKIVLHEHRASKKKKKEDRPCDTDQGYWSEHFVEDQIMTVAGSRGVPKPKFAGYDINSAPCICMHSKWGSGKTKGSNHYNKTRHAADFLSANPGCTVGEAIDGCLEGTLKNHRRTKHKYNKRQKKRIKKKVQKKMKDTVAECLKLIFLEYLTQAMNEEQKPTPRFTRDQVAAMTVN